MKDSIRQKLDRLADRFHLPGQVDAIDPEFLEGGIVDRGRERMLDGVTNDTTKLSMRINFHQDERPNERSVPA